MTRLAIALAAVLLLGSTCETIPPAIVPTDTDSCAAACAHVRRAGCTIGTEPDGEGLPCEHWCTQTQDTHDFPLLPSCWLTIPIAELTAPRCHEIEERCFGHEADQ